MAVRYQLVSRFSERNNSVRSRIECWYCVCCEVLVLLQASNFKKLLTSLGACEKVKKNMLRDLLLSNNVKCTVSKRFWPSIDDERRLDCSLYDSLSNSFSIL